MNDLGTVGVGAKVVFKAITALSGLDSGLFCLHGIMFMRTDTVDANRVLCYSTVGDAPVWLEVTTPVLPMAVVVDRQHRSAVLAVAELIAQASIDTTLTPEAIADRVLRGLGVPDDWTEATLRRWIVFGQTVGS